jgi:DNA sulfur modification protein DndB
MKSTKIQDSYNFVFPAIRGQQAGREYYVSMCPLKLIPRLFLFSEDELPAELRAQRTLNTARIPEIATYMIKNSKDYIFSSITASVDRKVVFDPIHIPGLGTNAGKLSVPMGAKLVINDGQHRRAAIEEALKRKPELGNETISVVFFIDAGLKRSQQMFADLNKHAVRPTRSLGILYDHRDPLSDLARRLIDNVYFFKGLTEAEKTTISNRSIKLFTLSAIHQATRDLLKKTNKSDITVEEEELAITFWNTVGRCIPEWTLASERKVSSADLRRNTIHSHGIALHAIGIAGSQLIANYPKNWASKLSPLEKIDWNRTNTHIWEGRAMVGGKISKAHTNLTLTTNYIKRILGLELNADECKIENFFSKKPKFTAKKTNDKSNKREILVNA